MKRTILLFCCILSCAITWAQEGDQTVEAKAKTQGAAVSSRQPDSEAKQLVVYPNPSNGIIRVTLAGFKGKRAELQVMNVIGNVVFRDILTEADNHFTKVIDLTKHANGLYYVKLEAEDFSEIRKIIIN